jgi:ribosome-binding factor A
MSSHRRERVRELLKRQIGEVIRREIAIEEAGLISVNDVGVAGDLHSATVFVSIIGTPEQAKRAPIVLERERRRIQSLVGHAVVLRYTPQLRFVVDDSIAKGDRVLQIINELEGAPPAAPATDSTRAE